MCRDSKRVIAVMLILIFSVLLFVGCIDISAKKSLTDKENKAINDLMHNKKYDEAYKKINSLKVNKNTETSIENLRLSCEKLMFKELKQEKLTMLDKIDYLNSHILLRDIERYKNSEYANNALTTMLNEYLQTYETYSLLETRTYKPELETILSMYSSRLFEIYNIEEDEILNLANNISEEDILKIASNAESNIQNNLSDAIADAAKEVNKQNKYYEQNKEVILARDNANQKVSNLSSETIEDYSKEPTVILDSFTIRGDYADIRGTIKNTTKHPMDFVKVKVIFYNSDDSVVHTNWSYASGSGSPLLSGESTTIKFMEDVLDVENLTARLEIIGYK